MTRRQTAATLDQLLARHQETILRFVLAHGAQDVEDAMIEGVHGLMDALSTFLRGSSVGLDALCVAHVERRITEHCTRGVERLAA